MNAMINRLLRSGAGLLTLFFLVLVLTYFNAGAYLTYKSSIRPAIYFSFIVESGSNPFPGTNQY